MDLGREIMAVVSLLVHYQRGKCLQRESRCSKLFQDMQNASEPGPISGVGGDGDILASSEVPLELINSA